MKAIAGWIERNACHLSYRDETGTLRIKNPPCEYTGFIHCSDDMPNGLDYYAAGDFWKIKWRDYDSRKAWLENNATVPTYEADLSPVRRIMADYDIEIQRPKRCYLDIETDSRVPFSRKEETNLLSWAVVSENGNSWAEASDGDERECLRRLLERLDPFDQVLAWNGDGFDFPVLKAIAKRNAVAWPRRLLLLDHLALFKRMNTASESGDEKQSMKLQSICMALLGEGKDDFDGSKTYEAWRNATPCSSGTCAACRKCLVRYNLQDTDLLRKLENKTGYADLFQTLCEVTHVFPDSHGLKPTAQVDAYMLRMARKRGTHFKTKPFVAELGDKYAGAFVMMPRVNGITRNVHVCDFASLYPSIIRTWNMSPETKGKPGCTSPSNKVQFAQDRTGMLPAALAELIDKRTEWKKRKNAAPPGTPEWKDADRKSTAYKVAANSFYGVMGSVYSRFYDRDIAESVTGNGQWLIKETIKAAEERGWRAIYGDTDSVFVAGCSVGEFASFVKWCNVDLYPRLLAECGCKENFVKLSYEKAFDRLVFPVGQNGESVAKRYVGKYLHYEGKSAVADSKPEIKGIEVKRGDTSRMARRLQMEVIDLLCAGVEDVTAYQRLVLRTRNHVMQDELPVEDIRMSKALSKAPEDYAVETVHVKVAKVMGSRGEEVTEGTRIDYVVTNGGGSKLEAIPLADYAGESDRRYLWNKLVYPPTQRLLSGAFPSVDWREWLLAKPAKVSAQLSIPGI